MMMKKMMKRSAGLIRGKELTNDHVDISIYVEAVSGEYTRGLHALSNIGPCVTVFGSARTKPGEAAYSDAMAVGRGLAVAGFAVATGGGGGIMEAANRGAALGGG